MSSVVLRPAVEQLAMLRARAISPGELAEEHIRQIERLNGRLHAFVDFEPERVRAQARALAAFTGEAGPLHGLPMSVKASIAVAGHRCETGSRLNAGYRPGEDAVLVARMRQAGAVVLGTTNCPEFLMAYETENSLYGRTANPWDLERTAGGSSGGEAAAIAAGMSAGGLGSDGGGSVREPAHFTGICSLKPTVGRFPSAGHLPPCQGPFSLLGAIGPMGRTMADVALFFEVLSGRHEADPLGAPVAWRPVAMAGVKVGFFEDDGLVPVTPETRAAVQDAVRSLRAQGVCVEPFRPKVLEEVRQLWWKLFVRCGAMLFAPVVRGREGLLSPLFREFLAIAQEEPPLDGDALLEAWTDCDRLRGLLLEEMRRYPLLLSPVCAVPAFRHGERSWDVEGQTVAYLDAMRYTQWWNVLGGPAVVIPVGRSEAGLPIGVQIAGRPWEDELVLAMGGLVERDFGFRAALLAGG